MLTGSDASGVCSERELQASDEVPMLLEVGVGVEAWAPRPGGRPVELGERFEGEIAIPEQEFIHGDRGRDDKVPVAEEAAILSPEPLRRRGRLSLGGAGTTLMRPVEL